MHPHPGSRSGVGSCEGKEADPRDQAMLCAVWREKSVHGEREAGEDTVRCNWRAELRRGIALLTKTSQLRVIFLMYSRSPCPRTFAESAMPRRILACQVGWHSIGGRGWTLMPRAPWRRSGSHGRMGTIPGGNDI